MLTKSWGAGILGTEAFLVRCEADVEYGLPQTVLIGSPSAAVRESAERVRTAVHNSGFRLEPKRVTLNLSPADLRKEGCSFDLPIAVALMSAYGIIPEEKLRGTFFAGELSLSGELLPVNGVLPMVAAAQSAGLRKAYLPADNLKEGQLVAGVDCLSAGTLRELAEALTSGRELNRVPPPSAGTDPPAPPDFKDLVGQQAARRAALLAAAGRHNLLLVGPAGTGKSMLAERLPGILPDMTGEEQLELTRIYSIAGLIPRDEPLMTLRPFRNPHHSISPHALAGGGLIPRPGEITLANHGILFLDELPEFRAETLEILRTPMEEHVIRISRTSGSYRFPADFQLVCAMNPCKCGFWPDRKRCRCTIPQVRSYLGRISQPLLDRIDLTAELEPVSYDMLRSRGGGPDSASMREEVRRVRKIQERRFCGLPVRFNAEMGRDELQRFCRLSAENEAFLKRYYERASLSARGLNRLLRVARTAADLDGVKDIGRDQLCEAIAYRSPTDKLWKF